MERNKPGLTERIEVCRNLCIDVSRNAGIAKAINEIISNTRDPEARYYLKSIFENQFKQLMIGLNILTLDNRSDFRIGKLVEDFEKQFGGKLKKLGLDTDIEIEEKYREELKETIEIWTHLRNNYAAHKSFNVPPDWTVDAEKISIFIESARKIINTMNKSIAVPQPYADGIVQSASYQISSAVNLEEESYLAVLKKLKWGDDL
jgi:hypothetical protein